MQIPPDPMNEQIPPAPMSPPGVAEMPMAPQGPELSQEEMRTNIERMMSQVQAKYGDVQVSRFDLDRRSVEGQGALLREMFDFFNSVGVDASNPEEIQAYIEKVKQTNPELAEQLETMLTRLVEKSSGVPGADDVDNMNTTNEEPQQNI